MQSPDVRLLLVSSDAALQRAAQVALDEAPVLVTAAAGLSEAARFLAAGDVDLVVVDGGGRGVRAVRGLTPAPLLALVDGAGEALRRQVDEVLAAGAAEVVPRGALGLLLPRRVASLLAGPRAIQGAFPPRPVPRAPLPGLRKSDVLVGDSAAMRRVLDLVDAYADTPYVVLVTGETGTGKELVARTLHAASRRGGKQLSVANCTAIPENLFESELFGHERGAFTGATGRREGLVASASGSSLLLDEIGDLPLSVQPKLLRFLESGEFKRVGGDRAHRSDARIIASTHRDLAEMVRRGAFREDLYYRLDALQVHVPPLRERLEDIPALVARFVALFNEDQGTAFRGFTPAALERLRGHRWPGNVRELKNVVRRSLVVASARAGSVDVDVSDVQRLGSEEAAGAAGEISLDRPLAELRAEVIDRFERAYLGALLQATGGNLSEAARRARHQRKSLWRMLKRHGMDAGAYRRDP